MTVSKPEMSDAGTNKTHSASQATVSGQQFKFENGEWSDTFQGIYDAGFWRLELLQ